MPLWGAWSAGGGAALWRQRPVTSCHCRADPGANLMLWVPGGSSLWPPDAVEAWCLRCGWAPTAPPPPHSRRSAAVGSAAAPLVHKRLKLCSRDRWTARLTSSMAASWEAFARAQGKQADF